MTAPWWRAGAEEGKVLRHQAVQQRVELRLHAQLDGGLLLLRGGGVEGRAAHHDS